ncbi:MAG TPA: ABC transporter permease [Bryobacteraceae bacterium]|nr:ABC transporter permease [Bryobacteraceae bacterium]
MIEDIRHSLVALLKNRGFALAAILSVGLGIGLNTTIFTFINAIFLQPLPVKDLGQMASIVTMDARLPGYLGCSYPNYADYRDRNQSFSSLLLYAQIRGSLTDLGDPEPLTFQIVSGNYFEALGVQPAAGRSFLPEEDTSGGAQLVAVISHGLWMRQFGGGAQVIGKKLGINGNAFQVIGVAPPGFQGLNLLNPADVWIPLAAFRRIYPKVTWVDERRRPVFTVAGRLKPGIGLERAEGEMEALGQQLAQQYPRDNEGRRLKLVPLNETGTPHAERATLTTSSAVLMIVSGLILLIACANVANLLLARAAGRNKEIAVRVALGASRGRLVRQLLTEGIVLALSGGALGLLLARWASAGLWALRPPSFRAATFHIELDGRVLGFTLGVSLLTGILFSLFPALRATNPDLATDLKERASQPASGMDSRQPRSLLVAAQVALSVVALIGAGLFIRSLRNAEGIDPGFDADHLGTVSFDLGERSYSHERGREFQRQVLEQVARVPGVAGVALSRDPMFIVRFSQTIVTSDDPHPEQGRLVLNSAVSPNYFRTTGIPLLRGRDFSALDTPDSPRAAVINEAAAARFWPGQDPIGKQVRFSGSETPLEIVGVARNANYLALGEKPLALFYTSMLQEYDSPTSVVFRTHGNPEEAAGNVRRQVQVLDPNLLLRSDTVRAVIDGSLWAPRLSAGLLGIFGILGLALATLGVYGVVSYSVNQRVREIGVRMALGATGADVQVMILRQGLAVVTVGVVAGLLMALGASRAVQSLLFVTSPRDALTFVLVPSILILAAILACWLPAYRATRIDPAIALRDE